MISLNFVPLLSLLGLSFMGLILAFLIGFFAYRGYARPISVMPENPVIERLVPVPVKRASPTADAMV